jgi:hypothetical protein
MNNVTQLRPKISLRPRVSKETFEARMTEFFATGLRGLQFNREFIDTLARHLEHAGAKLKIDQVDPFTVDLGNTVFAQLPTETQAALQPVLDRVAHHAYAQGAGAVIFRGLFREALQHVTTIFEARDRGADLGLPEERGDEAPTPPPPGAA